MKLVVRKHDLGGQNVYKNPESGFPTLLKSHMKNDDFYLEIDFRPETKFEVHFLANLEILGSEGAERSPETE